MKIFPTKQEKIITIAIVSFLLGISIGLLTALESTERKDLIPSVAALFAAFFGASTAFFLESRSRKKEKREVQLDAANQLLYVLFERLNIMKLFQTDFIASVRGQKDRMISMQPVANFHTPESELKAEKVSFLFQTSHKELMFELHVVNEQFQEAVNSIIFRSHIHLNVFQPLLEKAGHKMGEEITDIDVLAAIGERNFEMLKQSTDVVIGNVDNFIEKADKLRLKLITALSDVFSKEEIFNFELL